MSCHVSCILRHVSLEVFNSCSIPTSSSAKSSRKAKMKKYGQQIDAYGNPVVTGETPEYESQSSLLPTSTTSSMRTSVVDTSGFGMYSSGTGTGAITGGGIAPDQYITTPTAIQSQLPCSPAGYSSSEDDGMGGRKKKKGTKEVIEEKIVPAFPAPGMNTSDDGNGQQRDTHHEKKGLMERIKEKLPGHHHHHHH